MKNTLNLQVNVTAALRDDSQQHLKTAHALDVDVLVARIEAARQARASMEAALAGAPLTSIPTLSVPPPTAAPPSATHVAAKPRKTSPCKMYSQGRCHSGDACDFFHDPDALWTPERSKTWCWRYMAGVCAGQCKFWHPDANEMDILMKHTPCLFPACPKVACPRRHDDVDFDPEFSYSAQYRKDTPRLVTTISPQERKEHAAAMRARLHATMPLRVDVPINNTLNKASASPTESTSSSGIDSLPTPATSRADATNDWRTRDAEDRTEFPHIPSGNQAFAIAMNKHNRKGHARRQSVWVKKDENYSIGAIKADAGPTTPSWRKKEVVRAGHARSQSWAPFNLRATFP